jgi:hypothetical protein
MAFKKKISDSDSGRNMQLENFRKESDRVSNSVSVSDSDSDSGRNMQLENFRKESDSVSDSDSGRNMQLENFRKESDRVSNSVSVSDSDSGRNIQLKDFIKVMFIFFLLLSLPLPPSLLFMR